MSERWPDSRPVSRNPLAKNGTRCRPLYEDQDARISILANDLVLEGRIRFRRLLRASDTNRLPTGRAIRFCRRSLLVRPDGSTVDHLDAAIVGGADGVHQPVPYARLPPSQWLYDFPMSGRFAVSLGRYPQLECRNTQMSGPIARKTTGFLAIDDSASLAQLSDRKTRCGNHRHIAGCRISFLAG